MQPSKHPSVFISRPLSPDSFFHKKLTANGFEVTGTSLVEFSALPFGDVPAIDWLFFYSKNGVRFFFEKIQAEQVSDVKLAAIGPGTAAFLAKTFRPADFIGDGDPIATAKAFLQVAEGQRVLFPRAADSRRSVQLALGGQVEATDLVAYQNLSKKNIDLPDFDVLVFTSPLNAQAYFYEKKRKPGQRVIAIGQTTAGALGKLGISQIEVAEAASEEGLAAAVLNP